MNYVYLALIAYFQVFALGFQSRNVNSGNYGWAAGTSLFIGLSQAFVWRSVVGPDAGWAPIVIYACAGAIGIVSAMWAHQRFIDRRRP